VCIAWQTSGLALLMRMALGFGHFVSASSNASALSASKAAHTPADMRVRVLVRVSSNSPRDSLHPKLPKLVDKIELSMAVEITAKKETTIGKRSIIVSIRKVKTPKMPAATRREKAPTRGSTAAKRREPTASPMRKKATVQLLMSKGKVRPLPSPFLLLAFVAHRRRAHQSACVL